MFVATPAADSYPVCLILRPPMPCFVNQSFIGGWAKVVLNCTPGNLLTIGPLLPLVFRLLPFVFMMILELIRLDW
jgi:hypothetical protein